MEGVRAVQKITNGECAPDNHHDIYLGDVRIGFAWLFDPYTLHLTSTSPWSVATSCTTGMGGWAKVPSAHGLATLDECLEVITTMYVTHQLTHGETE